MTLFFPSSASNVKINASNSQVGVTVGDTMSISAGDSFTISGGSSSSIKIGPSTSFSIGSAVNINLSTTLSYTTGFSASYGAATSATSTSTKVKAIDSYQIQAGVHTAVIPMLTENQQIGLVILGTIVSMTAIAMAVLGGLSSPMFVTDPSNTSDTISGTMGPGNDPSDSDLTIVPGTTNPNAVPNDPADVARAACALAITTVTVLFAQGLLTRLLAKSTTFSPVANMLFNSTGITTSVETTQASGANLNVANLNPAPSVQTIMYADQTSDDPMLTHRVNQAVEAAGSPQLSEIILQTRKINLNATTKPGGGAATVNTQIAIDSEASQISLLSNSASAPQSGSIIIGQATTITNPTGNTTLTSGGAAGGSSSLMLQEATSATLSCTNGAANTGSVIATPTTVDIGVTPGGGSAAFSTAGVILNGTSITMSAPTINIGGALTILGDTPSINTALTSISQAVATNAMKQAKLMAQLKAADLKLAAVEKIAAAAQQAAAVATSLNVNLQEKMMSLLSAKTP